MYGMNIPLIIKKTLILANTLSLCVLSYMFLATHTKNSFLKKQSRTDPKLLKFTCCVFIK